MRQPLTKLASIAGASIFYSLACATPNTYTSGNVRVEFISPGLLRIEQKGPHGFEDRKTFEVLNRNFGKSPGIQKTSDSHGNEVLSGGNFVVTIPLRPQSLQGITVGDRAGHLLFKYEGQKPPQTYLPAPSETRPTWVLSDSPRMVPPKWGATPATQSSPPSLQPTSGWDFGNDAPDIYIFAPDKGGYAQIRSDFLALTGPVPKPPVSILGFIDSRYYPYTEQTALDSIDTYRSKGIPLDTFVVDTDWRVNGSDGYEVEKQDFPDMPHFIQEAHDRHVKLMFNDHPSPISKSATAPIELKFRYDGMTKLLDWGIDYWWYDRNWSTSLDEPMPGLAKEVWGQRLYHDITQRDRPDRRPWIMSNAEGIDNGIVHYAPNPAGHKYPMMWTGDTGSQFKYLEFGLHNGVNRGVDSLQPYTHEDLGGHTGPTPSPELYVRYLQYGCLSPITRVHCTRGQDRHPWAFGPEAEKIVTDYIKLRYRLLPMIYSAAQRVTDDGTPILRRCDLLWPEFKESASDDQYLLGDDVLVAPIVKSLAGESEKIPGSLLKSPDGQRGLKAEYFDNKDLQGSPKVVRTDANIDFDWDDQPAPGIPQENFSVRWTGTVGPVPTSGQYVITTTNDDGARVYVDDKLVIDDWKPEDQATNRATLNLDAGSTHTLRVEYFQAGGNAIMNMGWLAPDPTRNPSVSQRSVWIPPGQWQNAWNGEVVEGPKLLSASATLEQTPMWFRIGGVVLSGQDMQYTGEKHNDPTVANVFLGASANCKRELDEDDGHSNDYLKGALARTEIRFADNGHLAKITIDPTKGMYKGMPGERAWRVALHIPAGKQLVQVRVDGKLETIGHSSSQTVLFDPAGGANFVDIGSRPVQSGHRIEVEYR